MSKKLGLGFMFVGAYVVILGGLFFLMHFFGDQYPIKPKDYAWVQGVVCGVVIMIGAVLACKKYVMGYVGFGIAGAGTVISYILAFSYLRDPYNYLSPIILSGAIISTIGIIVGVIFHAITTAKARKYGESLL